MFRAEQIRRAASRALCRSGVSFRVSAGISTQSAGPQVQGVLVFPSGIHEEFVESRHGLMASLELPPRDLRLLTSFRGAHIAVRPSYFLFNFPPFLTGFVSSDEAVLITSQADGGAFDDDGVNSHPEAARLATRVLQEGVSASVQQREDQPFEHAVLETVLREDVMRKQERFARLAQLTRSMLKLRDAPALSLRSALSFGADQQAQTREQVRVCDPGMCRRYKWEHIPQASVCALTFILTFTLCW